jgi:ribonuclease HI
MNIIYFDGGARGNGQIDCLAGWAFVDADTSISHAEVVIGATNNEMEYTALIKAMRFASAMGYRNVEFRGDSKLVVEQCNMRWKVKALHLKSYHKKVIDQIENFDECSFVWVPRDDNPADSYYNARLDQQDD